MLLVTISAISASLTITERQLIALKGKIKEEREGKEKITVCPL